MKRYNPAAIEPKWQKIWQEQQTYQANDDGKKPKYYALSMFPYPSGLGLHIGHVRNFTITDADARFKRMTGHEVLHPMGWDSFGLPAENYAVKTGTPPQITTKQNTDNFREQAKHLGLSIDWSREFGSTDPSYYKWTQWFFLLLHRRGLAYQKESAQFWCDICKTVLANEQVVNGCCWRHDDTPVTKKTLKQWFFKITDYAERLEADLADLDWPESIKTMQRNWIGRSKGAEVDFTVATTANMVLLHGYHGSPKECFFPWVKQRLEQAGAEVFAPELPNTKKPSADEQAAYVLKHTKFNDQTVLLGHSYGSVTALRVAQQLKTPIKRLVLVAGFAQPGFLDHERNFETTTNWEFDFAKIKKNIKEIVIVRASNDSAVPAERADYLQQKLGGRIVDITATGDHVCGGQEPAVLAQLTDTIRIFTTRVDTLFGATFMVLAPEHPLASSLATPEHKTAVDMYIRAAQTKTDIDRMDDNRRKTGVFTGAYAINPANGQKIPVWVADYVLGGYGTGAIMAVPAHDDRDHAFAKHFNLPMVEVVEPETGTPQQNPEFRRSIVAIVRNPRTNQYLSLYWKKHKDNLFVGGGVEEGEDLVVAAQREIAEETGYTDVAFVAKTGRMHHHYYSHSKNRARFIEVHALLFDLKSDAQQEAALEDYEKDHFTTQWITANEIEQKINDELHLNAYKLLVKGECYHGEGRMVNSGKYDGMPSSEVREKIVQDLAGQGATERINYRIRDWLISRQRYWGAPIPMIHCKKCGIVPVPEDQLPVELPVLKDFAPSGDGRSPLAKVRDWVETTCPTCAGPAQRETDTMDGFACSSWYFLRFADPHNNKEAFSKKLAEHWLPVDMYIGGAEHAVMHLLYARLWTKVMYDEWLITFTEPFKALRNQGLLLAPDGTKFSKSKGNGVDPEDIINSGYGADALRTTMLFLAPFDQTTPWSPEGLGGVYRFLNRIWTLAQEVHEAAGKPGKTAGDELPLKQVVHRTIKKVTRDMHQLGYNTAIASLMELVNALYKMRDDIPFAAQPKTWQWAVRTLAQLVAPFAPHMAEELWEQFGGKGSVALSKWPTWDDTLVQAQTVTVAVQVNGKLRATLQLPNNADQQAAEAAALADANVMKHVQGQKPKRVIYVTGRLLNIVI